jgi:hypothetical protein
MSSEHSWRGAVLGLAIVALTSITPALAAETPAHQHEAGAHALQLDNGKKWQTDEPLRQAMTQIRDAVAANHTAIHANRATPAQYHALAAKVDDRLAYIVANCKLKPEADANLHVIVTDMIAGSDLMKGADPSKRRAGALKVIAGLDAYPKYFEHPGWRGL